MAVRLSEHVEEKFTHIVQVGGIYIPVFGKFCVI